MSKPPVKMRLYFEDEAPRIGCGWRDVFVKLDSKWAYLTDAANGRRVRLPKPIAIRIIEGK